MSLLPGALAGDFTGAFAEFAESAKLFLLPKDRITLPLTAEQAAEPKNEYPFPI